MQVLIKYDNFEDMGYIVLDSKYLKMCSSEYGWICGYDNDILCYIIPFLKKKKWFFTYMQIQSDTILINKSTYSEKEFLESMIIKIKKDKEFDFIAQPKTNVVFNTYPKGAIYSQFGSYVVDLSLDEKLLWKNIHTKHKNVIKRAIKNEVYTKFGFDIFSDAYNIIANTLSRNNMSMINKQKLLSLYETNSKNFLIGCSYIGNSPQGAVIILFDYYKGYYFWGGTNKDLSLGANNLLHWETIKKLKNLGVKHYDFVGARIHTEDKKLLGIQRFKSRFGTTLKQGYLWKYPLKPLKYKMFSFLYRLKMKRGDIIDQEKDNIDL